MSTLKITAQIAFVLLMALWAGIVIGVSLIATPVKFQAPSLTIPVGLEVGRYTFRLMGRLELCFLIAAIIAAGLAQPRLLSVVALALVIVEVVLQRYWLLPVLDGRVSEILAGGPISFSIHHWVYAVMEGLKATLLTTAAAIECRSRLG